MNRMSRSDGMSKLTVGEKIYKLRKHNRVPQLVLAEIMRVRPDRIVRVERGEAEYSEAHINAAKAHFDIVDLPLTEQECITFRERLYHWRNLLRQKKMDEAEVIHKEIAKIDNLEPCDSYLVTLGKMMNVRHLLVEGKLVSAEKILNDYQDLLPEMNTECVYHYYFNKGILGILHNNFADGLDFYLKAYYLLEDNENILPENDTGLYYNIAVCYSNFEIPYRAIFFLFKTRDAQLENREMNYFWDTDRLLALNYIKMNQLKDAERLLHKCLLKAESLKDDTFVGFILFCFGLMSKRAENWTIAVDYFSNALRCLPVGTDNYNASVFHKIFCTIHTNSFAKSAQLLDQTKPICNASEIWAVYFKALGYYLKISNNLSSYHNDEAIEYIQNIAIPFFIKEHDYFIAIDFYSLLERHYEKIKSTKKSLSMTKAIHDINKRCYANYGRDD